MKKKAIERDLVFIDIETTGLDPTKHEIIELAACRQANDFSKTPCWVEHKIYPEHIHTAEDKALEVNQYRADVWQERAVPLKRALDDLVFLCGDSQVTFVMHNPCFDWGFLRPALARFNLHVSMDYHLIDTASIHWPLVMTKLLESVSLENCCNYWNVSNRGAHSARRDVERTIAIYQAMVWQK